MTQYSARCFDTLHINDALGIIAASKASLPEIKYPLHIYGNGKLGKLARSYFEYSSNQIMPIFQWDEIIPLEGQIGVSIVTSPYVPIANMLRLRGHENVVPVYDLMQDRKHPLNNGWLAKKLTDLDNNKIAQVWSNLDTISRNHYLSFIAWRTIREEWTFIDTPGIVPDQHLIVEIASCLTGHEVFYDGGAYHGGVSAKLAHMLNGKYKKIYAFEADPTNYAQTTIQQLNRYTAFRTALADVDTTRKFAGGFDYCSKLADNGSYLVLTRTIDNLDLEPPTFIKLHLEGGEFNALLGAEYTMTKHRPIIATNVDHNDDGLWRTADYLMNLLPDYQFLFRNHCWCAAGSVLYAIPKERL